MRGQNRIGLRCERTSQIRLQIRDLSAGSGGFAAVVHALVFVEHVEQAVQRLAAFGGFQAQELDPDLKMAVFGVFSEVFDMGFEQKGFW